MATLDKDERLLPEDINGLLYYLTGARIEGIGVLVDGGEAVGLQIKAGNWRIDLRCNRVNECTLRWANPEDGLPWSDMMKWRRGER